MNRFHDFVEIWSGWLIHSGWQSAIVVAIVAVLFLVTPRATAQFRYAILLLALLKFAVPPFVSLPVGIFAQSRLSLDTTFDVEIRTPAVPDENQGIDSGPAVESTDHSTNSGLSPTSGWFLDSCGRPSAATSCCAICTALKSQRGEFLPRASK